MTVIEADNFAYRRVGTTPSFFPIGKEEARGSYSIKRKPTFIRQKVFRGQLWTTLMGFMRLFLSKGAGIMVCGCILVGSTLPAQHTISTDEFLRTALNDQNLLLHQQQLDFLKNTDYELPWAQELEFRTENCFFSI